MTYGKLTQAEFTRVGKKYAKLFMWDCDCGGRVECDAGRVRRGEVKSCGCLNKQSPNYIRPTHMGQPEHRVWIGMISRCTYECTPGWVRYGGRGIKVCDRWVDSYDNFIEDMGQRPTPKHQLDRIDNDGDYTPENCRWVTAKENARNTSRTIYITWRGIEKSLSEWSELLGKSRHVIESGFIKLGLLPTRKRYARKYTRNVNEKRLRILEAELTSKSEWEEFSRTVLL